MKWHRVLGGVGSALFLSVPLLSGAVAGDEHWDPQFGVPGVTNSVFAIALNNGILYASGGTPAGLPTNAPLNVWDGKQWSVSATFAGPSFMQVNDMLFIGNTLYVAGSFTNVNGATANGLAKWDGTTWSGIGFSGVAYTLAVDGNNNLYAGGSFTNAGGVTTTNIAYWDGGSWHALGSGLGAGGGSSSVRSIAIQNGSVYAGGVFTNSGSSSVSNLAVWDGTQWTQVGGGVNGGVLSLVFNGTDLYAGGAFTQAATTAVSGVAKWDGSTWSNLGGGLNTGGSATSMAFLNGTLCVVGSFSGAGGLTSLNFVVWTGSSWSAIGTGLTSTGLRAIATGTNVYVGGNFAIAGNVPANFIASWDGTQWRGLGTPGRLNGIQGFVLALGSDGQNVYAGGSFSYAGPNKANNIALFDGTNWNSFGSGFISAVDSIALFDNELIISSSLSPYIASWNGANWLPPTNDQIAGPLPAMAIGSNGLYLAGSFWFNDSSNHPAFYCARFDGTNFWSANPSANFTINNPPPPTGVGMMAVAVKGSDVFFGGNFVAHDLSTFPANVNATNIVRWDGNRWQLMGTGVNSNVQTMAVLGTNLYVGGLFTNASGVPANRIAMWNGNSWSAVSGGVVGSGSVFVLATLSNNLYAGGSFTNMGGVTAARIAKWDGTNWYALGSGLGGRSAAVDSLFAIGSDLYVGGNFRIAGDKNAGGLARWNEQNNFDRPQLINPTRLTNGQFQVRLVGIPGVTNLIQSSTNLTTWTPVLTNSIGIYDFADPNSPFYPYRFYRAVLAP
jgi:hypothetical protein